MQPSGQGSQCNEPSDSGERDGIGLIGLGNMGFPLALHLAERGCHVVAFDSVPAALKRAEEAGLSVASSVGDLAARCKIVLLSLPAPTVVRSVVLDLVTEAAPGTILVDLSTNDPETARDMHSAAMAKGVAYVDAPVSGGPSRARTGDLTVMVGGDEEAVSTVSPVMALVGKQVEHVGPSGSGSVAKLLNNFVAIWGMIGVSQAFLAADALGVPLDRFQQVLAKSSARSYSLDRNAPKIRTRDFRPDFSLALAEKDIRLALQLMRSAGMAPFAEQDVRDLFEASVQAGPDRDIAAIYETLGRASETGRRRA